MSEHKSFISCSLPATGITHTLNKVYDWAKEVVSRMKANLDGEKIKVTVWGHRVHDFESIAADFWAEDDAHWHYSLTFIIGESHNFDPDTPSVPDASEALHMIGMLAEAMNATITIGRRENETNRYCTQTTWQEGQTKSKLSVEA